MQSPNASGRIRSRPVIAEAISEPAVSNNPTTTTAVAHLSTVDCGIGSESFMSWTPGSTAFAELFVVSVYQCPASLGARFRKNPSHEPIARLGCRSLHLGHP